MVSTKPVDGEGIFTYHAAVLMPDTAEAYSLELMARGYMTIAYADGSTATIYAVANDNVRSMYQTAKNLVEGGETNAAIEEIIATCEAVAE